LAACAADGITESESNEVAVSEETISQGEMSCVQIFIYMRFFQSGT